MGLISTIAGLAIAVLASRSNPQAGSAAIIASQAAAIQSRLNFTRKHEKEADRIGFNILHRAGFDPHGMSAFFERLQLAGRYRENGAPSYLRTHPLTYERIADIESRMRELPYRQIPDSIDFHLVRAKLKAALGNSTDTVAQFDSRIHDKRYSNELAERYGLIYALLTVKQGGAGALEQYPFWLITSRSMQYAWGSNAGIPLMNEVSGNVRGSKGVLSNTQVARQLGIAEGDQIEVSSYVCTTRGPAMLSQGIRPDTLLMMGHFDHWATPYAKDLNKPSMKSLIPMSMALTDSTGSGADIVRVGVRKLEGVV